MKNFVCRFGLYHDKEVKNSQPSSNNGFIYTAFARKLGLVVSDLKVYWAFRDCHVNYEDDDTYFIYRLPEKGTPPISRDEIIGMYSLGLFPLKRYGWFMYREHPWGNADYLKAIVSLWRIRKEHRNYFWENKITDAYPVAMKLWWHDRYYIIKMLGFKPSPLHWIAFHLYAIGTILKGSPGEKNLLWLQLDDLSNFLLLFINRKKNFKEYFGEEHIFNTDREV